MTKALWLSSLLLLITVLFSPSAVCANGYYFQEEFNEERTSNTLDLSKWTVYPNTTSNITTIKETGGNLITYQANSTHQFPYVVSSNALPDGDYSTEIKFQYTAVTNWGTGIAIADKAFANGSGSGPLLLIDTWQDLSNQPNIRLEFNGQKVFGKPFDLNSHIFRVDRIGQKYFLYFDNELVFTTPDTSIQAKDIFIGNPVYLSGLVPSWTKFNVDYIRVKSLPPPKTPVIFIPGIGGSELKVKDTILWSAPDGHGGIYTHTYSDQEKVWVNQAEAINPGDDDYFDILRLSSDGQSSPVDLELTGNMFAGAYGDTLKFFTDNGYKLNQDLFIFPYDWRKDISLTAPLLDQKVIEIKNQTGSQKIDIIAHSMGGLVARNYIANPTKALNIRKLVTLGTPHLGSVASIKSLVFGNCITDSKLENLPFCLGINKKELRDVLQNMISGYELAPSQKYYDYYDGSDNNHPVPFVDNRDIDNNGITGFLNYQQIKTTLTNLGHNTSLFTPAETFHNQDNNLNELNGVDVFIIAGSGQATLGQIIEDYYLNFAGFKIPKTDLRNINGDNTVPLYSSSLTDGSKSLLGSAKVFYTNQKHPDLVFNGPAMNLVKNILSDENSLPSGTSATPFNFSGTSLSVHSPVLIHAYDQNNNHTGPLPNGDYEKNIPGSTYEVLNDTKFIWLPDNGIYSIKFEATDQGSFDFKIRDYKDDINDKTILYKDVPLTINTKAEATFNTTAIAPPILQVDTDGNGATDSEVSATSVLTGDESYDQTAPQTTIKLIGTVGNNSWYKSNVTVELNAIDETNGSGILKTEYSLDNGQTIQTYTNPFVITIEGITKLKVKSTDSAGNEENPQEIEIKIDKTAPEAKISFNTSNQLYTIEGIDNLSNVQVEFPDKTTVILTDEADNISKLKFNSIKDKGLEVKNITYNNNPTHRFPENEFKTKFELDKKTGSIKELKQKLKIEKQLEIEINYDPKKNVTFFETQNLKNKKQKEEKSGVIFIYLLTKNGMLEIIY